MDEDGFRAWLIEDGAPRKTQFGDAKHLDAALGDLDEHYEKDRLASLIKLLDYKTSHAKQRMPNPTAMTFDIDAPSESDEWYRRLGINLQNYKSVARLYKRFRDEAAGKSPALDARCADESVEPPISDGDTRERAERAIVVRRGQLKFRNALRDAYGDTCAVTGCRVLDVLEAAHIIGYRGRHTDLVKNGLLLRADIHTLFDCGLITLDPDTLTVIVKPILRDSEYGRYHGKPLAVELAATAKPDRNALRQRNKDFYERSI